MNTSNQILALITGNGKTAAQITHELKAFGNGSMQNGLTRMGAFFVTGIQIARKQGLIEGRLQGGVFVTSIFVVYLGAKHCIEEYCSYKMQLAEFEKEKTALLDSINRAQKENDELQELVVSE